MLSVETVEVAKEFALWKREPDKDYSYKCDRCGKHYDYRVFLIHKCNGGK